MTEDEKFRQEVLISLARIEAGQSGLVQSNERLEGRVTAVEHTVNGNGKVGIAEKVRFLEWKIAGICAVLIFAVKVFFGR